MSDAARLAQRVWQPVLAGLLLPGLFAQLVPLLTSQATQHLVTLVLGKGDAAGAQRGLMLIGGGIMVALLAWSFAFVYAMALATAAMRRARDRAPLDLGLVHTDAVQLFGASFASLTVFGLLYLLPLVAGGAVLYLAVNAFAKLGAGSSFGPLFVLALGGLVSFIMIAPLFMLFVPITALRGASGGAALIAAWEFVTERVADWMLVAFLFVVMSLFFGMAGSVLSMVAPSAPSLLSQLDPAKLSVDGLIEALGRDDNRPLWASVYSGAVDLAVDSVRQAFFLCFVTVWFADRNAIALSEPMPE